MRPLALLLCFCLAPACIGGGSATACDGVGACVDGGGNASCHAGEALPCFCAQECACWSSHPWDRDGD